MSGSTIQRFNESKTASQVRVTRAQHRGEPRRLFLAPPPLTRLFEMPVVAHDFERAFAVDLFLQSPQRFLDGLAFFQLNLCQTNSLPLRMIWGQTAFMARRSASVRVVEGIFAKANVNRQKDGG